MAPAIILENEAMVQKHHPTVISELAIQVASYDHTAGIFKFVWSREVLSQNKRSTVINYIELLH